MYSRYPCAGRAAVLAFAAALGASIAGCADDGSGDPRLDRPAGDTAQAGVNGDSGRPDTADGAAPDASETADAGDPQGDPDRTDPAGGSPPAGDARWTAGDTRVERQTGVAMLRSVRTATHEDFDRIVLDFGEDPLPGYRIEYVDRPVRQCGSGNIVDVAGDGWLSIEAIPARAHTEEGQPTVRDRSRTPGLPNVKQLTLTCDYEAHVEWVAGVASPTRYRVLELKSPTRLVVDVLHPGGAVSARGSTAPVPEAPSEARLQPRPAPR